jgi:hypothetical protein
MILGSGTAIIGDRAVAVIEVDFEVFKELTNRRAAESVTYNDVIRDLLGWKQKSGESAASHTTWGNLQRSVLP